MLADLTGFTANDFDIIGGEKLAITVDVDGLALDSWLQTNAAHLNRLVQERGAVLVRGIEIRGTKKLGRALSAIFAEPLIEYSYRSTPRTRMRGRIYTSSEYHPDETISQHNENAYSNDWPMYIAFYCVEAAALGGATPIADSRKVYDSIAAEIREEFERRGLLYVRNYGDVDLPWAEVFQTENREEVEAYCRDNAIEYEWLRDSDLRTKQHCAAVYAHPRSGERLWFNQAHLFHISSLSAVHRDNMLRIYRKDDLPRNVYFGDGGEIDSDALAQVRKAYEDNKIAFDWQENDLLMLDNMLYSHGRQPFRGERSVLVGMAKRFRAG